MFYGANDLIFQKAEELRNRSTPAEDLLWNYLKGGQLGVEFRRQHPAGIYVLDFYCHELRLAVELDGSIHEPEEVKKNDEIRETTLRNLGIRFLRFANKEIFENISEVINKIHIAIKTTTKNNRPAKSLPSGAGEMQIIPAIDIIDGKCVRLTQGDYAQKTIYNEHPLEVAKRFEDAALTRLHLVDLDGAKAGAVKNWKVLEAIAGKTKLVIDFGGGIKTEKDVNIVFESGAAFATVGSIAVKDETTFTSWLEQFGADKFLLGADVKDEKIAVAGWLETTDIWIYDFIEKYINKGIQQIFCTDVSKDGKLEGPSIDLYKNIISKFPSLHFIASGGVSSMNDIYDLMKIGCKGVIIGKAIYEGRINLSELVKI
ncbi:MAG: 1-(5-phosphoribosyl)-5-[(5-phosphoribosylamino)methylideneamino] imidazole-4-carboxamide isomerase [Segetibacter sp.]|nr:1-(5-phosphoribosyl)-5-[(5-phosphoribosylamino)methylideneamino] imidazole-4-carboxamide isomerase [Segetibacter sp.]